MGHFKKIACGMLPITALLVASAAPAKVLGAFFTLDNTTNGYEVMNCGTLDVDRVKAKGYNSSGVVQPFCVWDGAYYEGTSAEGNPGSACNNATQHAPTLYEFTAGDFPPGNLSGGWASDLNAGTNIGWTQYQGNFKTRPVGGSWGSCSWHVLDVYSYGKN